MRERERERRERDELTQIGLFSVPTSEGRKEENQMLLLEAKHSTLNYVNRWTQQLR
jgi:hypothetical protein